MEFHTTGLVEGAACMCEGVPVKSSTLPTFEGLYIQAKKEQKKYFQASQKILTIFKLKKKKEKEGDLFMLGLVVKRKSPQMIYCLTFVENNAKKLPLALCILTL